jgi:hypothetical protein
MRPPSALKMACDGVSMLALKSAYVALKTTLQVTRYLCYHLVWKRL